jgi:hypothetical protein
MTTQFTSAEKVLFKATFNFWIKNGLTESEANEKAMNKIIQKRSVVKSLKFKY